MSRRVQTGKVIEKVRRRIQDTETPLLLAEAKTQFERNLLLATHLSKKVAAHQIQRGFRLRFRWSFR